MSSKHLHFKTHKSVHFDLFLLKYKSNSKPKGRGIFYFFFFLAYGSKTILISFKCILLPFVLAQTHMNGFQEVLVRGWLRAAEADFGGVCGSVHAPGAEGSSRSCPALVTPWEIRGFGEGGTWGVLGSLLTSRGCCLSPLLQGDAEVSSGLVLGPKAVPGAPVSLSLQIPILGRQLPAPRALWASAPIISRGGEQLGRFWSLQLIPLGVRWDPRSPDWESRLEICLSQGKQAWEEQSVWLFVVV